MNSPVVFVSRIGAARSPNVLPGCLWYVLAARRQVGVDYPALAGRQTQTRHPLDRSKCPLCFWAAATQNRPLFRKETHAWRPLEVSCTLQIYVTVVPPLLPPPRSSDANACRWRFVVVVFFSLTYGNGKHMWNEQPCLKGRWPCVCKLVGYDLRA